MNSKKPANNKRATLPRASDRTNQFVKDWVGLNESGRFDMPRLKLLMLALINNDGPLDAEWLDHELKGAWKDHRECHVHGDFLLIYRLDGKGKNEQVIFVRTGTHAALFE